MTPYNSSNKAIFIDTSLVNLPVVIEFANFTDCAILKRSQVEDGGRGMGLEDHCINYSAPSSNDTDQGSSGNNDNALRSLFSRDIKDVSYMENPAGVGYLGSVEM